MNRSTGHRPPNEHDGDDGGGGTPPGATGPSSASAPTNATASSPDNDAEPNHDGFVTHRSKKARKKAEAAATNTGGGSAPKQSPGAKTPPEKTPAPRPDQRPVKSATQVKGSTTRKKVSPLNIRIMQLREHAVMKAEPQATVDVLARVQHLFRTATELKDPKVRARIIRTYEYDNPTDRSSITRTLRDWFTGPRPYTIEQFKHQLRSFELINVPPELVQPKKNPWSQALLSSDIEHDSADGDSVMQETPSEEKKARWTANPRAPTNDELLQLARLAKGEEPSAALPSFLKATSSVMTAAFLSTVVATKTRGRVMAQLRGAMTVPPNATQAFLIGMISTDISGPCGGVV